MTASRVVAVMPVYGKPEITADALHDLSGEGIETWVVDNRGDHVAVGAEKVLRPGRNLGWLGGTNAGVEAARADAGVTHVLLTNNDVRLSRGLVRGLLRARAGVTAPAYDGFWQHQHTERPGPARSYVPGRTRWRAGFVDGTCLLVDVRVLDAVGPLDQAFDPWGWGAEVDLGFKAADAGFDVVVTDAAYVEHSGEATAIEVHGVGYGLDARARMYDVLTERYGPRWELRAGIDPPSRNTVRPRRRRRVLDTAVLALPRWTRSRTR